MTPEALAQITLFVSSVSSATVLPGSSEAVFAVLLIKGHPWLSCLIVASIGNWIGGMTSYGIGRLGRWSWIEKLGVKEAQVRALHQRLERWGSLAGLLAWLPVIGDGIMIALGFFRVRLVPVALFTFFGRLIRYGAVAYLTLLVNG
ncbi:MAG: hypothetical protein A2X94_10315 [Bdellovibrionales bacterium GWB1_55_8]|nr:MAG: hypothetical protein A2X94_10315 [Bdellovibrionales bacterium GWB1_55_8]